ncbi:MAG: TRAP transporter small permease [Spirochaetales bacterium]|nr:TRAP transporter small permease [Spirochaetales bacterium]
MIKRIFKWLDINFEPVAMAVLFYVITLLVTLQVILRFVFATGFSWGEEVARFLFVWLMYFSIAYATRNQRHIRVAFLVQRFGVKAHKIFMMLGDLVFLIFSSLIFISAVKVCQSIFKYQDMAVTINVSLNIVYGAGVVGFALIIIRLIQTLIYKIKNFNESMEVFENYAGEYTGADKVCFFPKSDKIQKEEAN